MEEVFVVGVGMTPFGRMLDLDIKTMTRMATEKALADAELEKSDVKAAFFATFPDDEPGVRGIDARLHVYRLAARAVRRTPPESI